MKIVVNSGRTVHVTVKPGVVHPNGTSVRPEVRVYKPTNLIDTSAAGITDAEANRLIAQGFASKYEPPKAVEADPKKQEEKK